MLLINSFRHIPWPLREENYDLSIRGKLTFLTAKRVKNFEGAKNLKIKLGGKFQDRSQVCCFKLWLPRQPVASADLSCGIYSTPRVVNVALK